jgi:integrase
VREQLPADAGIVQRGDQAQPVPTIGTRQDVNGKAGHVLTAEDSAGVLTGNARKGFFEASEFEAVLADLPEALKPVAQVAYVTGWRIRSELLTRQWSHVDFQAGWIRLEPGETKNREGRMFPLTPTLRAVLERQRAHTRAIERDKDRVIP